MNEISKQQSTSILELLYLIRAKNKGELSFTECWESMLCWAKAVITEYELAQTDASAVNEDQRHQ